MIYVNCTTCRKVMPSGNQSVHENKPYCYPCILKVANFVTIFSAPCRICHSKMVRSYEGYKYVCEDCINEKKEVERKDYVTLLYK